MESGRRATTSLDYITYKILKKNVTINRRGGNNQFSNPQSTEKMSSPEHFQADYFDQYNPIDSITTVKEEPSENSDPNKKKFVTPTKKFSGQEFDAALLLSSLRTSNEKVVVVTKTKTRYSTGSNSHREIENVVQDFMRKMHHNGVVNEGSIKKTNQTLENLDCKDNELPDAEIKRLETELLLAEANLSKLIMINEEDKLKCVEYERKYQHCDEELAASNFLNSIQEQRMIELENVVSKYRIDFNEEIKSRQKKYNATIRKMNHDREDFEQRANAMILQMHEQMSSLQSMAMQRIEVLEKELMQQRHTNEQLLEEISVAKQAESLKHTEIEDGNAEYPKTIKTNRKVTISRSGYVGVEGFKYDEDLSYNDWKNLSKRSSLERIEDALGSTNGSSGTVIHNDDNFSADDDNDEL